MQEIVPYRGWTNNLKLANALVEVITTLDVGPRILAYRKLEGFNVLKNYDSMMGGMGEAEWQIRGGHRFWLAPEDTTRTYFADNRPVQYETVNELEVKIVAPPEEAYGVQKTMHLKLDAESTKLEVRLLVENVGTQATELAPWGPTVMAPGGVEIIPLPPKYPHPGHPKNAKGPEDFAPNQELILWPYFDFADRRWTFGSKYILLRQNVNQGPTKIGLAHRMGWVAYLNSNTLFVKRFDYREGAIYPDRGTRYQTFSNEDMLEMETVGELVTLQPGEKAVLSESWELHDVAGTIQNEADVDRLILPLIHQ